jgi:hypothetical protein
MGAAQIVGVFALGLLIPNMGLPQPITGPLVNALLILSVEMTGVGVAVLVGLVTPLSALLHGVLPLPLVAMIPFILAANAIFATTYSWLRQRSPWLGVAAAALAKFIWLYVAVTWMIVHPPRVLVGSALEVVDMSTDVARMMQWPQVFTALAGGLIALGLCWSARCFSRRS